MKLSVLPWRRIGPTPLILAVLLALLALAGAVVPVFVLSFLISLLIYTALAYSINFITGLTGYVSFGHVVFMGTGGYAMGFLVDQYHVPPLAGVALGALTGLALALGVGLVTLRFRGVYFAIASLVTVLAGLDLVLATPALGGGQGIYLNIGFAPQSWFYTIWAIVAAEVALTTWITRGRLGVGIRAIKGDEDAAKAVGINAPRLKLYAFLLSGLFAGAAGAVFTWTTSGIFPYTAFGLDFSLLMLAMIVVGGMGTVLGPVLGGVIVYVPSYLLLASTFSGLQFILIGFFVIVIALFIPEGIVGALRKYVPEWGGWLE